MKFSIFLVAFGFSLVSCKSGKNLSSTESLGDRVSTQRTDLYCYGNIDYDDPEEVEHCRLLLEKRGLIAERAGEFRTYVIEPETRAIIDIEGGREYITKYDYINGERVKVRDSNEPRHYSQE